MIVPSDLTTESVGMDAPPSCAFSTFTIHSNVCVGDMIAIIACSIAGIGFLFWGIHAIRKMREFPFNYEPEDKKVTTDGNDRVDPYHVPSSFDNSLLVRRGAVRTPSPPERVRTRLLLSQPEGDFYRSTPISADVCNAQDSVTAPRMPLRAGGQSQRLSSHRSSRHGSLTRGGPYSEGHEWGMNEVYVPSRVTGLPVRSDGYMRTQVSPSRARASGDYCRQSMNIEPTVTYAY